MKTVKSKTTYEVHGREFTDKAKAEAAEKLLGAKEAYEQARETYGRMLAETFKTADGWAFKWCEHYWWITSPYNAMPRKIRLWCYPSNTAANLDEYHDNVALKIQCDTDHWGNNRKSDPVQVPIDELYREDAKADEALRAAQLSWLDEMRQQVEKGKA